MNKFHCRVKEIISVLDFVFVLFSFFSIVSSLFFSVAIPGGGDGDDGGGSADGE